MINNAKFFDIQSYFKMGQRRKWYIIIPFTLAIIISFGVYKYLPKVYRATAVILIQSPRVPESYVRSTLTESLAERLNTISQEIISGSSLERVIKEFNLYSDLLNKFHMEAIVDMMRKKIEVKVPRQTQRQNPVSFSISFEGTEPETVMKVTNKLASMVIEEDLKSRELQAGGTVEFISKELQTAESNMKKGEAAVRRLREKYMGELPEQLGVNLRILERLQEQLRTTSDNLRAAEDKMVFLQNQIEQSMDRRRGSSSTTLPAGGPEESLVVRLNALRKDLTNTESKYTESHPDVVDLKRKIAALIPRVKKQEEERERRLGELRERREEMVAASPSLDPATERLVAQYEGQFKGTQLETKRLKEEVGNLNEKIALYQRRIEETPKREQEMVQLNREYDLLKNFYQSLVDKQYQSKLAENLELRQQGGRFRMLDSARLPGKPFKPDVTTVLVIGALSGLAIGLGLAWFRESMDRSFYEVSELETYLQLPVLATLLNLNEEEKKAA